VAANLAAVAIGTETDGSIVCPSSSTGLVGIKPTVGLVSRSGIIPISHSQDTAGPMTRTVRDAALVLTALAGVDPSDQATSASDGRVSDYSSFLDPAGLRGARLGVARNFFGFHERVDRVLGVGLDAMRTEGAVLIDPVELKLSDEGRAAEMEVLLYELKTDLDAYLSALAPTVAVRSLADVIRFNEEHRELEMPYFEQDLFLQAAGKGGLTDDVYLRARALSRRLTREDGIDALMETHELDAIVAPTGGPAWLIDLVNGDHFGGGSSSFAAIAGYPNITVPAGEVFGLPVGVSFFGRAWSEPTLIRIAYAFEQATRQRTPPQFLPTLGV
jgi:amidase